jgi:hypothetical protein
MSASVRRGSGFRFRGRGGLRIRSRRGRFLRLRGLFVGLRGSRWRCARRCRRGGVLLCLGSRSRLLGLIGRRPGVLRLARGGALRRSRCVAFAVAFLRFLGCR